MIETAIAVAGAVGFACLLGRSDAPNAVAALVSCRVRSYRRVEAWSVGWHLLGGLLAGEAVAHTTVDMVHLDGRKLVEVLAAASWAAVIFTWATTRVGYPTSASVGLVGGMAGAGMLAGGLSAVSWGGFRAWHPFGVFGVLFGIVAAPFLAAGVAALVERVVRPLALRARRSAEGAFRAGVWAASAAVAVADGSNDGQKAMGILAASLAADGGRSWSVSWTVKITCAVLLAVFTVIGGGRVVATVARRLWRASVPDDLAAQVASAAVVFLAVKGGLPLSTSTVVTSAKVGAGVARKPRHVHLQAVGRILENWAVTVPACAGLACVLFEVLSHAT